MISKADLHDDPVLMRRVRHERAAEGMADEDSDYDQPRGSRYRHPEELDDESGEDIDGFDEPTSKARRSQLLNIKKERGASVNPRGSQRNTRISTATVTIDDEDDEMEDL